MRAIILIYTILFLQNYLHCVTNSIIQQYFFSVSRAMSPAQSEDSGLAADRGTTYATISIPRQNAQALGLIFSGKINVSVFYMPFRIYYSSEMILYFFLFVTNH